MKRVDSILMNFYTNNLPKAQGGGEWVVVDGKRMLTTSPEYKKLYNKGIGYFDKNGTLVSSKMDLPPVTVTAKIKPNSVSDYSTQFYKTTPYQDYFNSRMAEEKQDFESSPLWAQRAVGGWNDKRTQVVTDRINDEYQNKFVDFVSDKLQKRNPQGSQGRNDWLSNKNFTNKELSFLTGSSNLPEPNLWAQTGQGLYNTLDFTSLGALPELAMPGIARSEVDKYNNPLLAASFLSVPAKAVQSLYKDNYSLGDALTGRPNNASFAEDVLTDPFTYLTLGSKGFVSSTLNRLGKVGKFINKVPGPLTAAKKYIPGFGVTLNESVKPGLEFVKRAEFANNTIREQGEQFVNRLLSAEGQSRLRNQFKLANPYLKDDQLDWLVQTRINEVNNAAQFNSPRFFLEHGQGAPGTLTQNTSGLHYMPMENAHFGPNNFFPDNAVQSIDAPSNLFPTGNRLIDNSQAGIQPSRFKLAKDHPYVSFTDPNYQPGTITLGTGYELNKNVARHELAHSVQASGAMPVDMDLLEMIKPKNTADILWRAGVRLDPELKENLRYFVTAGGRNIKNEAYPFLEELRNRMLNRGIINDEYQNITPWTLVKARLDALRQTDRNVKEGTRLLKFTPPWKYGQLAKIMNTAPAVVPVVGGAGALAAASGEEQKKKGGPIEDPRGQWAHPGEITRIPGSSITMYRVPYPVYAKPNKGKGTMMYPGENYFFPKADYVDEYPMMSSGGQHGGLDRWFAEKWVDIKTGKACGRQEGEERRSYPACRPSRRVNEDTPKTASELSSSEREKFKRSKTSSERINYQHRRKEFGGEQTESDMANKPNNPSLWSKAKSLAKQKFDVYPSAYANGWAAKWYKGHGGTWRKAEYGMEVPQMAEGGKPEWLVEAQLKAQGYSGDALQQKMNSMAQGGEPQNAGFQALPDYVQQKIMDNMAFGGYIPEMAAGGWAQQAAIAIAMKKAGKKPKSMKDGGDPDGSMALGQIDATIEKLQKLRQFIQPDSDLEPWVNSKLTLMDDYSAAVSDYMTHNPEAHGEMEEPQGLPMEQMKNGGIPQRYKNMGFTHVGQKKQGDGKHKWKVLAKKGDQYKVVQGGWRGMQDFSQHHSEKRRERFWDRMGGRNSSKATDPFSPLYWHKRFGTWEEGGEIDNPEMKAGGSTFSGNAWYENGGYIPEYNMGGMPCYECGGSFEYGGIHLDPAKKGTFKAQATRMGMGVQEAASHILANKEDYSPAMVKKANFARNFAKKEGGYVVNDEVEVTPEEAAKLRQLGYEFDIL